MTAQTVDKTLDCKGLSCPMPIVRTRKAIGELKAGQVLEVLATDAGSVADMKSWANRTGHQFIGTVQDGDVYKHYVRKADPNEEKPEKTHPDIVSNEELMQKLEHGPVVLDVREPMEYAFGHIPNAKSVPLGQLEQELSELQGHTNDEVYVICRTGNRSDAACQILTAKGFSKVKNVVPGMSEWSGPLEKMKG